MDALPPRSFCAGPLRHVLLCLHVVPAACASTPPLDHPRVAAVVTVVDIFYLPSAGDSLGWFWHILVDLYV